MRNDLLAMYYAQQQASPALPVPMDGLLFYYSLKDLSQMDYVADGASFNFTTSANILPSVFTEIDGVPCRVTLDQNGGTHSMVFYGTINTPSAPQEITTFSMFKFMANAPTSGNSNFQVFVSDHKNTDGQVLLFNPSATNKTMTGYNRTTKGNQFSVSFSQTWQVGQWYTWAQTFDAAGNFRLYINGVQKAIKANAPFVLQATSPVQVFRPPVGTALAHYCYYNRALSAAELLQMTNALIPQ